MLNLLYTEILKLKRSKMFLISIIGASVTPFMCFIERLSMRKERPDIPILFKKFFSDTNFYFIVLIGILLYGVITAYIFNREYIEDTLKGLLTIPVSRISFIVSKFIMLLIWIMVLTIVSWILTLVFGLIGQFEGLSIKVLINSFKNYIIGGSFLFLLTTPVIFVTFLFKNFVPTIVFTIGITMVNVLITNSRYVALFPWSATVIITDNTFVSKYPLMYSYISIFVTSIIGFIATIVYFKKEDIN
ncbi:ABC-2 family transporter protein [Gottschalkia purinilytica]|uniref:ABC-2 family transporter protein n=1 Tax=Gottschalkia purinilytica TaxID=1503 RepID=A0A0L0WC41_GOTPU|nr:ABC transporter permease [Gottschalkia purinilytica]KNF09037.1 ABC-2 family transporter protein [Gottschalkia purinilytica]